MMKVLQIVKYSYPSKGGMESVVKDIVEGVSNLDKDIDFTVYSNANSASLKGDKFFHNGILYVKERTFGHFKSQPLALYYKELGELIKQHDVIHHHYPFPNIEINLVAQLNKLINKKFVMTWHANIGQSRWKFFEKMYDPLVRKLLDRADSIVVTSPQLVENSSLLNNYIKKIEIIPLSYNAKYKLADAPKSIEKGEPLKVLFVGRLREYKGLSVVLHAIKDLNVKFSIVGNGEYGNYLKELVSNLQISSKVSFFENFDDDQVERMYEICDLFILPSINEAEAFGVVQLEAMAKGLPVINTKLKSGVPFVSLDNVTGITVKPRCAQSLKEAIIKVKHNPELYTFFSANALDRVKLFTREKLAQAYLDIFRK